MNSLKSACSFAKSTPVTFHQFQQHLEPCLRRQGGVELIVGFIRVLEIAKYLNDTFHAMNFSMSRSEQASRKRRALWCQGRWYSPLRHRGTARASPATQNGTNQFWEKSSRAAQKSRISSTEGNGA